MKIKFLLVLFCLASVRVIAQSVSIEPGQSIFANSTIGTQINSSHTRPLKISSEEHLTPIDFYNYSQLHG
ncbi:hypothetical protein ACFQ1A_29545, partial [Massilia pinisoli]|uniref:hypothetical protein n=1 Tax=Massilia pinisoli TaxID=1772194 RepID=UPI00363F2818